MADHVCPIWVGYLLLNPLRKILQNPGKMLGSFITDGMTVLDVGSAMGFFSLPMAEMVGSSGRVICVDLQREMLDRLIRRAAKKGLDDRIVTVKCETKSLNLDEYKGSIDFALASAVVHEVPDRDGFFAELYGALKPGAHLLVNEPKGHVSEDDFSETLSIAAGAGFSVGGKKTDMGGRTAVLTRAIDLE